MLTRTAGVRGKCLVPNVLLSWDVLKDPSWGISTNVEIWENCSHVTPIKESKKQP